ncbi:hypothetical protein [Streptomyces sp. NPDC047028]|uniref:hypothetical protein n=1 Tax=Streptomyces sp. NPDC047028 TaxID=3155793 RepID=UPI00340576B0
MLLALVADENLTDRAHGHAQQAHHEHPQGHPFQAGEEKNTLPTRNVVLPKPPITR